MIEDKEGGSESQAGFANDLDTAWEKIEAAPETEEPAPVEDPSGEQEQAPSIAAPEHWSQQDKDAFNALPENAKPLYLEKVKSLESGYNRKFEEIADERKSYEGFKQIFGPDQMQQLAERGETPSNYVAKLIAVGRGLEANPEAMLHWLAQRYGVTLGNDELPAVSAMTAQVQQLQTQLQHQAINRALAEDWFAFQSARGANGSPLYPGVEKLKVMMGHVLQANPPQANETVRQALERAYRAAYADAEAAIKPKFDAEAAARQRKADLDKARRAGDRRVKSKTAPGTTAPIPAKDWKEELERNWDQAGA